LAFAQNYQPKGGYVPDSTTAVRIAEACRFRAAAVYRAVGAHHNGRGRCAWNYAHYPVGAGQWEARDFSRDGREIVEGFWWQRRQLLVQQAHYDLAQVRADRIKLHRLRLA
jgi:hypothetical protein